MLRRVHGVPWLNDAAVRTGRLHLRGSGCMLRLRAQWLWLSSAWTIAKKLGEWRERLSSEHRRPWHDIWRGDWRRQARVVNEWPLDWSWYCGRKEVHWKWWSLRDRLNGLSIPRSIDPNDALQKLSLESLPSTNVDYSWREEIGR